MCSCTRAHSITCLPGAVRCVCRVNTYARSRAAQATCARVVLLLCAGVRAQCVCVLVAHTGSRRLCRADEASTVAHPILGAKVHMPLKTLFLRSFTSLPPVRGGMLMCPDMALPEQSHAPRPGPLREAIAAKEKQKTLLLCDPKIQGNLGAVLAAEPLDAND